MESENTRVRRHLEDHLAQLFYSVKATVTSLTAGHEASACKPPSEALYFLLKDSMLSFHDWSPPHSPPFLIVFKMQTAPTG